MKVARGKRESRRVVGRPPRCGGQVSEATCTLIKYFLNDGTLRDGISLLYIHLRDIYIKFAQQHLAQHLLDAAIFWDVEANMNQSGHR